MGMTPRGVERSACARGNGETVLATENVILAFVRGPCGLTGATSVNVGLGIKTPGALVGMTFFLILSNLEIPSIDPSLGALLLSRN